MKKRLIALAGYAIFWLVFFFSARMFFILTHFKESSEFGIVELASTFVHGIKLDISATGYIFLLPVLIMIPGIIITCNWYRIFLRWYTYIIIIISSCIIVADTLLYKYWGYRMDYTAFLYLKTPKEAAASVTFLQIIQVLAGILIFTSLFIYLYNRFIDSLTTGYEKIKPMVPGLLFFLLLWGSLIIPIRGGFGIAPINAGTVYFTDDMFVNHTSVNVVWNAGSSVFNRKPASNPYQFTDTETALEIFQTIRNEGAVPQKILNTTRPNILFIILESFGNTLIGSLDGDTLTTPCFNRYSDEGILFTNFYASGNRTDKAMPAIINGYPAQPTVSIMKEPKKTQSLPGIVNSLVASGYNSSFWYGGEINFANFNSYVINSGFRNIITKNNFSSTYYNSKWGVHDHILFERLRDSMETVREPFIRVVLTLSSHEPFEVPMEPVFEGKDDLTKFRNSVFYADKTVGSFLDWAKEKPWWSNTLIILVADHCRRNSSDVLAYSEEIFRIPMLWLGGALAVKGMKVDMTASQVDIPVTLLHQLGMNDDFPFSKDIFAEKSDSYAFYTFNEGFAFITDSSKYVYDHKLGSDVEKEGKDPELAGKLGKAYLQVLYDDFLKR